MVSGTYVLVVLPWLPLVPQLLRTATRALQLTAGADVAARGLQGRSRETLPTPCTYLWGAECHVAGARVVRRQGGVSRERCCSIVDLEEPE